MSTNGQDTPEQAPIQTRVEEPYVFYLVVEIHGHGTFEHMQKEAAAMKRRLDVGSHTEHKCWMAEDLEDTSRNLIPVTWPPVQPGEGGA